MAPDLRFKRRHVRQHAAPGMAGIDGSDLGEAQEIVARAGVKRRRLRCQCIAASQGERRADQLCRGDGALGRRKQRGDE